MPRIPLPTDIIFLKPLLLVPPNEMEWKQMII